MHWSLQVVWEPISLSLMHKAVQPKFSIIYADPPWRMTAVSGWNSKGAKSVRPATGRFLPYPCMHTEDICKLDVKGIAADDSLLFLWAIYPMLPDAFKVMEAWGFTYKTVAFTWVKLNPKGVGYHFGMGMWTRANPEICLLGVKGHPIRQSRSISNLVVSPRREHSRKPEEIRNRIVALCGDVPRAELFAREKTRGWSVWGNEVRPDLPLALA